MFVTTIILAAGTALLMGLLFACPPPRRIAPTVDGEA
jgi:hypothetical protein